MNTKKRYSSVAEQLAAHTDKSGECWVWTGAKHPFGYGVLTIEKRRARAHRVAYELAHGPIPVGQLVLHRCDNPACIRPDHLFAGTHDENMRDMRAKGRAEAGENHHAAKLTEANVREILAAPHHLRERMLLAEKFGITLNTVIGLQRGRNWASVRGAA